MDTHTAQTLILHLSKCEYKSRLDQTNKCIEDCLKDNRYLTVLKGPTYASSFGAYTLVPNIF